MHMKDLYRVLDWLPADALRDFHDLSLFWSIKHYKTPKNFSQMFASHNEVLEEDAARRITRSVTQNGINRTQENDSRNTVRASSFVPRMVRTFNALDDEYKRLPDLRNKWGHPRSLEDKFLSLKRDLKRMVQWRDLGIPTEWPQSKSEALLDRSYERAGLGIESSTSEEEDEQVDVS